QVLDVLDHRPGDLAVRGVEDLEGDLDAAPFPFVAQRLRLGGVDVDAQGLQAVGAHQLGVGEGAQGGPVDLGDEHDGVDAGGAHHVVARGVRGGDLLCDAVVVAADRGHRRVEDAHAEQGDPGSV